MPERREPAAGIPPQPERFRAAFGVGAAGESIHPADAIGVPLAAIQGLHGLVQENRRAIDELRARVELAEHRTRPSTR